MSGADDVLYRCKTLFSMAFRVHSVLILCFCLALESLAQAQPSAGSSSNAVGGTSSTSPQFNTAADASSNALAVSPIGSNSNSSELTSKIPSAETNPSPTTVSGESTATNSYDSALAMASYYINIRQPENAEPLLVGLLAGNIPDSVQKTAMLKLGEVVRAENDLPRAQSIYTQYLQRWPGDIKVPEILLRQGEIFRQMGLNDLALGKFYSVMTAALSLKNDQLDYYQSLVLQTQIEIADTHYLMGQFADAADFYLRLLQNPDPALNRAQVQFHLIRSLSIIGRNNQAAAQAQDFITRFPDAEEVPETRYYLAEALKALGRNAEALQQVLLCLQEQNSKTRNNPELWAYWQQRVGNEIANQLYHEGDYVDALEVYINLAQLNSSPAWQVPVDYQMGLTYEQLLQPQKAVDTYNAILARETEAGTNTTPALKTVFDMARWRVGFIQWQTNAESIDHSMIGLTTSAMNSTSNAQTSARQ